MGTFGPGDYGSYNDWAWSGANSFWTNWNSSSFATGTLGRVTALGVRWDGSNNAPCTTCTGRNDMWDTGTNLVLITGTYGVVCTAVNAGETMHNVGTSDYWQSNGSYYIGIWRPQAQCTAFGWRDGVNGGYAGKSADDGTNGGGTGNWGGTVNGGLPVYGTVVVSNVYVKRAGVWTQAYFKVKRSGSWSGPVYVYVKRAGSWTLINELKDFEPPAQGVPVLLQVGNDLEYGWMIEEGQTSWFGSVDPKDEKWHGKYNSFESDELAETRLKAVYEHDQALRSENYQEATKWFYEYQPPGYPRDTQIILPEQKSAKSIVVPSMPEYDPEPIMVPCGCA